MAIVRPPEFQVVLSPLERAELTQWAHALAQRTQAILLAADGLANTEVAQRVHLSQPMVGHRGGHMRAYFSQAILGTYQDQDTRLCVLTKRNMNQLLVYRRLST